MECPFDLWCFYVPLCQQQKRKLRLYISNTFNPARPDADDSDGSIASWELRVEGKLLDDVRVVHLKYTVHVEIGVLCLSFLSHIQRKGDVGFTIMSLNSCLKS